MNSDQAGGTLSLHDTIPHIINDNKDLHMKSADVKRLAKALGADAVGIGSIDRWEGAPVQMDPRQIMPECRSVIAMAFRVMRGSLRGIEEGAFFSNYPAMGYGGLTYLYIPLVVMDLCKAIEDDGCEAIPIGHQSDWRAIDGVGNLKPGYSRPVAQGRAAPDVMVHLRIAGYLCGLGEIGWSKLLLTPQFGPRNRVGIVLTEAELEPDPIYDGPPLCNKCKACVSQCPGNAIPRDKRVTVTLAGRKVSWADIDCCACDIAFRGGEATTDPVAEAEEYHPPMHGKNVRRGDWTPFYHKPRNLYNTGQAVCGARGCIRACMVSMEKRGVMSNTFTEPFRRRPQWTVNWDEAWSPEQPVAATVQQGEAD